MTKTTEEKLCNLPKAVRKSLGTYKDLIRLSRERASYAALDSYKLMVKAYCDGLHDAGIISKETATELEHYTMN